LESYTVDRQFVQLLLEYCAQHQLPVESMLADHQASEEVLNRSRLPFSFYVALMEDAAARLDDELLGLHLVQQIRLSHLGTVGLAQLASGNWQQIIDRVLRYSGLWANVFADKLEVTNDYAQLTQVCRLPEGHPDSLSFHHAVFNVGMAQALAPIFSSRPLLPIAVGFRHAPVSSDGELEAFFGPNISFNQEHDWIRYSIADLNEAIGGEPDPEVLAMLDAACEEQLKKLSFQGEPEWLRSVRKYVIQTLPLGAPVLADASKAASLSVRQLRRYLAAAGTGFRELVDDVRRELASQYLKDRNLSLVDIALMLGYTEQSAFQRAYQRWYGRSPGQSRAA
jgi:AraC-like DNA-binding protein